MDTIHCSSNVSGAFFGKERVKGREGFDFASSSIQERSSQHVHALHVGSRFRRSSIGVFRRERKGAGTVLCSGRRSVRLRDVATRAADTIGRDERLSAARRATLLLRIVELPRDGVQKTDQARFANAAAEEGVGGQSSKGVVSDLGIGRRGASVDETKIFIRVENRRVEEYEPDVDSGSRLVDVSLVAMGSCCEKLSHHAITVAANALVQDLKTRALQRALYISIGRSFSNQSVQRHGVYRFQSPTQGGSFAV